jgi:nucleoside-diphosphate-sugar epimerase
VNSDCIASADDQVLVTGSNGFIGAKTVEILIEYGFSNLRCFAAALQGDHFDCQNYGRDFSTDLFSHAEAIQEGRTALVV